MRKIIKKIAKYNISFSLYGNYLFISRLFFRIANAALPRNYLKKHPNLRKLQIGCGYNVHKGWLNTDYQPANFNIMFLDASKKFTFKDNTFDYIFSEHIFEHLKYSAAFNMLKESYRVLKKGGKIRIATPNLQFLIDLFNNNHSPIQKEYVNWSSSEWISYVKSEFKDDTTIFVINNFFRDWGHEIIYDFRTLKSFLEIVGFSNVAQCKVGISKDPNFINVEGHFNIIPSSFNELETLVVEAIK